MLASVNGAAVATAEHASLWTALFSGYAHGSGAGSQGSSIFGFLRTLLTVLPVAVPVYSLSNGVSGPPLCTGCSTACALSDDDRSRGLR